MEEEFEEMITIRMSKYILKIIQEMLDSKDNNAYESRSHLIRCAVLKLHREVGGKWD